MNARFNEDTIEQAALELLREVGYGYIHGGEIAPGEPHAERGSYGEVLLVERLRASLHRINDHIPAAVRAQVIEDALPRLTRATSQSLLLNNYAFHKLLTEGVDVSYREGTQQRHAKLWLVDTEHPTRNDWLAVNQFTVEDINPITRTRTNRRPDIVLFINGLPLVVIELKNAADETANLEAAYHQLQTYKDDIFAI